MLRPPRPHLRPGAPRPPRAARCLLLVAVLAATAAAGCSSSDDADGRRARTADEPPTTVAFATWQSAVEQDCAAATAEFAHLATAAPQTAEEAVAHSRDVDRFAEELRRAAHDGGVPDERTARVEEFTDHLDALAAAAEDLATNAVDGDGDAVAAAAAELSAEGARLNPLAVELGVPSCGGF